MNVKFEKKDKFIIAGLRENNIDPSFCPKVWDKLFEKYDHETLLSLGNRQHYGSCLNLNDENKIDYMVAYDVHIENVQKAIDMGLEILIVNPAEYAIFSLQGPVPDCIFEGWNFALNKFFPENNYKHSLAPDFEVYSEGDIKDPNYKMELWVPVTKL